MKFIMYALTSLILLSLFSIRSEANLINTDVTVGTKTTDSTAEVTISNSQIQSQIITVIQPLAGSSITSDAASIIVSKEDNYLVFKVTTSSGTQSIAIQLSLSGNTFKFLNKPGSQVHRCFTKSSCGCNFAVNEYRAIIGCGCNGNINTSDSCTHRFFPIR